MKSNILFLITIALILMPFAVADNEVSLYLFFGKTCPHCRAERQFLDSIEDKYPNLVIHEFEVSKKENIILWQKMCDLCQVQPFGVPMTFIGEEHFTGYSEPIGIQIEDAINKCIKTECPDPGEKASLAIEKTEESKKIEGPISKETENKIASIEKDFEVDIPFIGEIDLTNIALVPFTFFIALIDGFNPCTIWVLSFLLALLIHVHNRRKILIVGGVFLLMVYIIYFLFMTAWLSLFLYLGYIDLIRVIIALIAILAGIINMKDFFWFKKGISLSISNRFKPKLFEKMRTVVKEESLFLTIIGTIVLASFASLIELPCTSGFPAIYTKILSMQGLKGLGYYLYISVYCLIYIVPLTIIIGIFAFFMKGEKMTEKQGRILKFIGGFIMLALGLILLIKPDLLMFR